MPDYLFEFIAHIDERKRPESFPRELRILEQYNGVPDDEQVKELYNKRVKSMVQNPGLVAFLDPDAIIDTTALTFDKRVFVPWHMITFFHGRIKVIHPQAEPSGMLDDMALPEVPPQKGPRN